jgi:hypothetical protein
MAESSAPATISDLNGVFSQVVSVALGLGGVAFFVMFVVGGFQYLTAGGDPKAVEGAKKTLTYAVFGLVAVALSFLVIRLIADFTGVGSILHFNVYQPS